MAKFRVGDLVKIREWDDMAKEYGVADNGDIRVYLGFPPSAKALCGKVAQIIEITCYEGAQLRFVNPNDAPKSYFPFSLGMLVNVSAPDRADVEIGGYAKVISNGKFKDCVVMVTDGGRYEYNSYGGTVLFPKERRGEHCHFDDTELEPIENIDWLRL